MIEDAEDRSLLAPGGTIVEPTSGNTGVALAMLAAAKGYRCVIVMPEGYGKVKALLMEALGARVVRTPAQDLMTGAIARARRLQQETPGAYMPDQFSNPVNPRAHYETLLSQRWPGLRRVAAEPQGSILGGGAHAPHRVEGIGLSFFPAILDRNLIDEVITITDEEAFETCRLLARQEGLLAGGSSGVAAAAALRVARRLGPGKTVVTIFPDGAERYPDQGIFEKL